MLHSLWRSGLLMAFAALYVPILVLAIPQNVTVDDQDFIRITYKNSEDWRHDPLEGLEHQFYNGSRSYTYVPGASASFSFTGSGIYLQGPYANDQALRRITLDGQDMGIFDAHANNRTPAGVFWSKKGMESTAHTVIVTHNDTATKIFAMDAWIVEFPSESTPFPIAINSAGTSRYLKCGNLLARIIPVALLLTSIHGLVGYGV